MKHFVNSGYSNFLGVELLLLQNASVRCFDQATAFKLEFFADSHQYTIMKFTNVTSFWENDPNRTSVKIKLTPPMDSYTTILLVQTLVITQTTEGWF